MADFVAALRRLCSAVGADSVGYPPKDGGLSVLPTGGEGALATARLISADRSQLTAIERLSKASAAVISSAAARSVGAPRLSSRENGLWYYSAEISYENRIETPDGGEGGTEDGGLNLHGIRGVYFLYRGKSLSLNSDRLKIISLDGLSAVARLSEDDLGGYSAAGLYPRSVVARIAAFTTAAELFSLFPTGAEGELIFEGESIKRCGCTVAEVDITADGGGILDGKLYFALSSPYFFGEEESVCLTELRSECTLPFTFPAGAFMISSRDPSLSRTIVNDGTVDCGMEIELYAASYVKNPYVANLVTLERARVETALSAGERIVITTDRGNKRITLISEGGEENIFSKKAEDFCFLPLYPGENRIGCGADAGLSGLDVTIRFRRRYTGVG